MVTIVQHRVVDVRGCIPSGQDSNYGDAGQVRYPSWGRMVCACRGMAQQGHEMDRASVSRVRTDLHEDVNDGASKKRWSLASTRVRGDSQRSHSNVFIA